MFAYIPLVYCFLPETSGRTLEQIDYLFASKSAFTWKEEKEFEKRMTIFNENIAHAEWRSDKEKATSDERLGEKAEDWVVERV
jgi:hypothetical protein